MKRLFCLVLCICLITSCATYAEISRSHQGNIYKIGDFFVELYDYWIENHSGTDYLYVEISYTSKAEYSMFFETGVVINIMQDGEYLNIAQRDIEGVQPYRRIIPGEKGVYREVYKLYNSSDEVYLYLLNPDEYYHPGSTGDSIREFVLHIANMPTQKPQATLEPDNEEDTDGSFEEDSIISKMTELYEKEFEVMTIADFMKNTIHNLTRTMYGKDIKVGTGFGEGNATIIIGEKEYDILRQALKICIDHPEWIQDE